MAKKNAAHMLFIYTHTYRQTQTCHRAARGLLRAGHAEEAPPEPGSEGSGTSPVEGLGRVSGLRRIWLRVLDLGLPSGYQGSGFLTLT